jgi:hypothetical protein
MSEGGIMRTRWKLGIETVAAAALGGYAAYFFVPLLPGQIAAEVVAAIGGTMAVSGSLLGFAVSWLGQSRTMLRDIDYDSAAELFTNLAQIQRELIIRWGVVLACSLIVVGVAAVLKGVAAGQPPPSLGYGFRYGLSATVSALTVGIVFVWQLFSAMIAVSDLKSKLDEHEREELRKRRNAS